jgi:hypothetical protein
MQRLEGMHFQHFAEPTDDKSVMLHSRGVGADMWDVDALQHGLNQRLL